MSNQFAVGDVVKLKSGGPQMTVESLDNHDQISCIWFNDNKKHKDSFHKDLLLKVDQSSGGFPVTRA
jgi:uncharacterized protein YodC (DUF2158 family)